MFSTSSVLAGFLTMTTFFHWSPLPFAQKAKAGNNIYLAGGFPPVSFLLSVPGPCPGPHFLPLDACQAGYICLSLGGS